jgi:hypothetical protein
MVTVHPHRVIKPNPDPLRHLFFSLLKTELETRVSRERDLELYFKFRITTS